MGGLTLDTQNGQTLFVRVLCMIMLMAQVSLPNMSSETAILNMSPVNSHVVCLASMPEVPSNTCIYIIKSRDHHVTR